MCATCPDTLASPKLRVRLRTFLIALLDDFSKPVVYFMSAIYYSSKTYDPKHSIREGLLCSRFENRRFVVWPARVLVA
jgi:hypothetical protein